MHLPIRARLSNEEEEKNHARPVRLVLMEAIDGPNMRSVFLQNSPIKHSEPDAFHLPESYRLDIMANILDAGVGLFHAGIRHRDHYPRNILIVPDPRQCF